MIRTGSPALPAGCSTAHRLVDPVARWLARGAVSCLAVGLGVGPVFAGAPADTASEPPTRAATACGDDHVGPGGRYRAAPDLPADLRAVYRLRWKASDGRLVGEQEWRFERRADVVAVRKGDIEDHWHRDARGSVSLVRLFHRDRRAVDYSAGELRTLGIAADWGALQRLVPPDGLRLEQVFRGADDGPPAAPGAAATAFAEDCRMRFGGARGLESWQVDWLPATQLPSSVVRLTATDRYEIALVSVESAGGEAPAVPADMERLDAADFGDMPNDPFVRRAEARDVRAGWRPSHGHGHSHAGAAGR